MSTTNPLDIIKRLDVKQNVTIRVIDEPTGKVVQEHIGHNAATNSLLTGIAHYLMGDGVLNQGSDTLSMWVPQYISLGTMGLTSQDSETIEVDEEEITVPAGIGYTPVAPASATAEEKELNAQLRFEEYINQAPGFGADGYDSNTNNNREWFGLGYPYSDKPAKLTQDFYDAGQIYYELSNAPLDITSVTVYPEGVINQNLHDSSVTRMLLSVNDYETFNSLTEKFTGDGATVEFTLGFKARTIITVAVNDVEVAYTYDDSNNTVTLGNAPDVGDEIEIAYYTASTILYLLNGDTYVGRIAAIYTVESQEAVNCEVLEMDSLRSQITYRNIVPEVQSEIPNTLDVIYSAFVSTGSLKQYRGNNDYIYITEAGLWSKAYWNNSGDNGLLAGYRIMPTDDDSTGIEVEDSFTGDGATTEFELTKSAIAITFVAIDGESQPTDTYSLSNNSIIFNTAPAEHSIISVVYTIASWKDMSKSENRQEVQKNIIRVGTNQVAQIIWKLQLGGLEQLNGLRFIYPPQYPEEVWNVWTT